MNIRQTYRIPSTDKEAWEQYNTLNWVYDTQRLLDAQHIKWSPFYGCPFRYAIPIHHFDNEVLIIEDNPIMLVGDKIPGKVFIENPGIEKHRFTETVIVKGEIKMVIQTEDNLSPTNSLVGEAELRIYAFVTMYFQKFSGCASFETYGNEIYATKLRPTSSMLPNYEADVPKLLKRHLKRVA